MKGLNVLKFLSLGIRNNRGPKYNGEFFYVLKLETNNNNNNNNSNNNNNNNQSATGLLVKSVSCSCLLSIHALLATGFVLRLLVIS